MNKKTYISFNFIFIILLFLVVPVLSAPPFQVSSVTQGCEIDYSKIEIIKLNQAHTFNFHVINSSNGISFTNATLKCIFHLYNKTGNHLVLANTTYEHDYDYQVFIAGGNFSDYGEMSYILQCNNSVTGCFVSIPIKITSTGYEATTPQNLSTLIAVVLLITIGIILFLLALFTQMPTKIFLLSLSILIIVFAFGFGLNVLNNNVAEYSNLTTNFSHVYTLFTILLTVGGLGLIIFLVVMGVNYFYKIRGFKE